MQRNLLLSRFQKHTKRTLCSERSEFVLFKTIASMRTVNKLWHEKHRCMYRLCTQNRLLLLLYSVFHITLYWIGLDWWARSLLFSFSFYVLRLHCIALHYIAYGRYALSQNILGIINFNSIIIKIKQSRTLRRPQIAYWIWNMLMCLSANVQRAYSR